MKISTKTEALTYIEDLQNYLDERNIKGFNPILDDLWYIVSEEMLDETEEMAS